MQSKRRKNRVPHVNVVRRARDLLDDRRQNAESGIGIALTCSGREEQRRPHCAVYQLRAAHHVKITANTQRKSGAMIEQLRDRDVAFVRGCARNVFPERIRKPDFFGFHKLQNGNGGKVLGIRTDLHNG